MLDIITTIFISNYLCFLYFISLREIIIKITNILSQIKIPHQVLYGNKLLFREKADVKIETNLVISIIIIKNPLSIFVTPAKKQSKSSGKKGKRNIKVNKN